jgi:hypothetical protein
MTRVDEARATIVPGRIDAVHPAGQQQILQHDLRLPRVDVLQQFLAARLRCRRPLRSGNDSRYDLRLRVTTR